jgi:pantoate--beta-alanine ligase
MIVTTSVAQWRALRRGFPDGATVGFVPTMGALHEGHAELLRRAGEECDISVLSVFVNPTQFNDPSDLEKYPRTLEQDCELAARLGVNHVLVPEARSMYADGYRYQVTENRLSRELEGSYRPGHFDGVLTVVLKLFQLVRPDRAYFGEKDFQQLELVRGMADAFFLGVDVIAVPTVRETDGLAMSSRNTRLSEAERRLAPEFARALRTSALPEDAKAKLEAAGFGVDYIEDRGKRRFGAVRLGDVRLIDNVETP